MPAAKRMLRVSAALATLSYMVVDAYYYTPDVPEDARGCGGPRGDEYGNKAQPETAWGLGACGRWYPRTCQFTFQGNATNYEDNVKDEIIPKTVLPGLSEWTTPIPLQLQEDNPLYFMGDAESGMTEGIIDGGCEIKGATVTTCFKESVFFETVCTQEEKFPDLTYYPRATDWTKIFRTEVLVDYFEFNGVEILVKPPAPEKAASFYSAVRNTAINIQLTCYMQESQQTINSCLLVELEPKNEIPDLLDPSKVLGGILEDDIGGYSYHFGSMAVASAFVPPVTDGTPNSKDVMVTDPTLPLLTRLDDPFWVQNCINGDAHYLGEDGSWISVVLVETGLMDLRDTFYVNLKNVWAPVIQRAWAPYLEEALEGRLVRMEVTCYAQNIDYVGDLISPGYIYIAIGETPYTAGGGIPCSQPEDPELQVQLEAVCGLDNLKPYLPRDSQFALSRDGAIDRKMYWGSILQGSVGYGSIPIPPLSELQGKGPTLSAQFPLHDPLKDPIVDLVTGEEPESCTLVDIDFTFCEQEQDMNGETRYYCSQKQKYVDLKRYEMAPNYDVPEDEEPPLLAFTEDIGGLISVTNSAKGVQLYLEPFGFEADQAFSLYSVLRRNPIRVLLKCDFASGSTKVSSLLLDLEPVNDTPDPQEWLFMNPAEWRDVRYAFIEPAVPTFMHDGLESFTWDDVYYANPNNGIRAVYPLSLAQTCQAQDPKVLGEAGEWYGTYLGDDGRVHDMKDLFFVDGNLKLQRGAIPMQGRGILPSMWNGRVGRLWITCKNIYDVDMPAGWMYFGVGPTSFSEGLSCYGDNLSTVVRDIFCRKATFSENETVQLSAAGSHQPWMLLSISAVAVLSSLYFAF